LTAGLAELRFAGGADVILEGPATFRIDDRDTGTLDAGRLAAMAPPAARGFTIRTPSATVIDRGTEFGVSVDADGTSEAHVFAGRVEVAVQGGQDGSAGSWTTLAVGQAARVQVGAAQGAVPIQQMAAAPDRFVRRFPHKALDLVDMICGGDGHGQRRGAAIDCSTGKPARFGGDLSTSPPGGYNRMPSLPMVDGVFIPTPAEEGQPIQTDSAGSSFAGFRKPKEFCHLQLLAGGTLPDGEGNRKEGVSRLLATLDGVCYSDPPHFVLAMHAPQAITFDLAALRRANPGMRIERFRAVTGNAARKKLLKGAGLADAWVLVDGRVVTAKEKLAADGPKAMIDVVLDDKARFLTLATTDGGDTNYYDYVIFGDPVVELAPAP
jgi:hypothetical protein